MVTFYPSRNGSGRLVGVDDGWFSRCIVHIQSTMTDGMQVTYRNSFRHRRFSYEPQRSCFNYNSVGMIRLVCHQFLKGIFPNPQEYLWIFEVSVIFHARFIGCTCFIFFSRVLLFCLIAFLSVLFLSSLKFLSQLFYSSSSFPLFFSSVRALKFLSVIFAQSKLTSFESKR